MTYNLSTFKRVVELSKIALYAIELRFLLEPTYTGGVCHVLIFIYAFDI